MTAVMSFGFRVVRVTTLVVGLATPALAQKKIAMVAPYVPPAGAWERRSPSAMGMDSVKLADAIAYAIEKESKTPRDLELNHYQTFGREPFGAAIGPLAPWGVLDETTLLSFDLLISLLLGLLPDCGPIAGEMGGDKQRKSLTAVSIIAAAQHVS